MDRLTDDIVAVLDAENLQKPVVVASGFAGEELSRLGSRFPTRTAGLIFLDAAYDRRNAVAEVAIMRRVPQQPPRPEDLESIQSVKRWQAAGLGFPIPEAEIRQSIEFGADGRLLSGPKASPAQRQIFWGTRSPITRRSEFPCSGSTRSPGLQNIFRGVAPAMLRFAKHAASSTPGLCNNLKTVNDCSGQRGRECASLKSRTPVSSSFSRTNARSREPSIVSCRRSRTSASTKLLLDAPD
jgi:pimeloyl-ACP methyl ester carboxylesterase